MARKHKRRSYGGIQTLRLNGIASAFKGSASVPQVAIGLAVGVAGIFALKKWLSTQAAPNANLVKYAIPVGAVAAAVAAFFVGSKVLKSNAKGTAMAVGAALGGAFLFGYKKLSEMPDYKFLQLSDTVGLRLNDYGFLVDSAGPKPYGGFIVDSPRPALAEAGNRNLGRLAAMHENDDFDGLHSHA